MNKRCEYCGVRASHGLWVESKARTVDVCDSCASRISGKDGNTRDHAEFAEKIASYYNTLKARGMSDESALRLTQDYQDRILDAILTKPNARSSWLQQIIDAANAAPKEQ
jgi:ribosome-binding protein aMBF1 (putative translation factor)